MYEYLAILCLMAAGAIAPYVTVQVEEGKLVSVGTVFAVALAVFLVIAAIWVGVRTDAQVEADQRAAAKQGITVVVSRSEGPRTIKPCEIQLGRIGNGENTVLILPGTNMEATPDLIAALC